MTREQYEKFKEYIRVVAFVERTSPLSHVENTRKLEKELDKLMEVNFKKYID